MLCGNPHQWLFCFLLLQNPWILYPCWFCIRHWNLKKSGLQSLQTLTHLIIRYQNNHRWSHQKQIWVLGSCQANSSRCKFSKTQIFTWKWIWSLVTNSISRCPWHYRPASFHFLKSVCQNSCLGNPSFHDVHSFKVKNQPIQLGLQAHTQLCDHCTLGCRSAKRVKTIHFVLGDVNVYLRVRFFNKIVVFNYQGRSSKTRQFLLFCFSQSEEYNGY